MSDNPSADALDAALQWSIARFCAVTGRARATVSRRFAESGLQAVDTKNGHPVYRSRDGLPLLYESAPAAAASDPDKMAPRERRDWYESESKRLEVEHEQGLLVPVADYVEHLSRVLQVIAAQLDDLPSQLERKLNLDPEAVVAIEAGIDESRDLIAQELKALADRFDAEREAANGS